MKNKTLYLLWACMFILCGLLGFIHPSSQAAEWLLMVPAVLFFVPGWMLLYRGVRDRAAGTVEAVRNLSLISLGTTLLLLVLNFLSGNAPEAAGVFLHGLLVVLSVPMFCAQYWVFSLFLWACLLTTSVSALRKLKKSR